MICIPYAHNKISGSTAYVLFIAGSTQRYEPFLDTNVHQIQNKTTIHRRTMSCVLQLRTRHECDVY